MSDLSIAKVVAELRLAEGIFKEDPEAYCAGDLLGRAADLIAQQAASLEEADAEAVLTDSLLADERRLRFAAEAEKERLRAALEWIASEIEGERNLITHPHGRRAHHIDSQDEIRVEVLTGLLDRTRAALSEKETGDV